MNALKLFPYAGSKHKYQKQIQEVVARLNVTNVDTYIEPFAGSLGSFFHIMEKVSAKRIIISDINPKIINIYQQIKTNPAQVMKTYKALEESFQASLPSSIKSGLVPVPKRELMQGARDLYYWAKDYINVASLTANHAAVMIFVLNHNFNGLYSESKKSGFNVAFNWNARRIKIDGIVRVISEMHTFFTDNNVEITTMDVFELLSRHNNPDTFIYLDPPYINNKITYVADGFDLSLPNQMKLLWTTNKYKHVMYSNHHHVGFSDFLDGYINFNRTNKISGSETEKKPIEIMGYRTNVSTEILNNTLYKPKKASSNKAA